MLLFRPVGLHELRLIAATGFRAFPPRLPDQPIFYPVLDEAYAIQIARDWNPDDPASGFAGFVTKFDVDDTWIARHPIRVVGASEHRELWIPADDLPELNARIQGRIAVVASFPGPRFEGRIDPTTHLPI